MFGIGGFELFLILLFGFLIFGPDKLPAIAKTLGKAIAKFRNAQEEMSGVLKGEMVFDKDSDEPFKNPLDVLDDAAAKAKKGADAAKKTASTVSKKVSDASKSASGAPAAGVAGATAAAAKKAAAGNADASAKGEGDAAEAEAPAKQE
ncbi:MAG: twin-arginine translocase TatA/TatE family subunit, partial [Adlercreutzia sp.]|nr:twin-arginine translocase TatA/TatE family subunit [Adlercreutzia sp.]